MKSYEIFFQNLYKNFNARKIDEVINNMSENVKWANGMDGGYVYGHNGVREYWVRQFKIVSAEVTPMEIKEQNEKVTIKVHQVVHDLTGNLLSDEVIEHVFKLDNDKILEFQIRKQ